MLCAIGIKQQGEFLVLGNSCDPKAVRVYIIEELNPQSLLWIVKIEYQTDSAGEAASKWIETRPLHTFRIREKQS